MTSLSTWSVAHPRALRDPLRFIDDEQVEVPVARASLGAVLFRPPHARASVIIAHPSGIARLSRLERFVAGSLARAGFTTLLLDLLTEDEDAVREGAHADIPLLADRLLAAARWMSESMRLPLGYFGVGHGAAAALVATAIEPNRVLGLVSRGGRPDYAGASLLLTRVPSLFIVDGNDPKELAANRAACGLSPRRRLDVVPSPGGSFLEGEALDRVTALSAAWFGHWLDPVFTQPEWV
ncbi:MAG: hydrolase [Archangium sp.]|nr:hydrolase [Archangium sp.]